MSIWLCTILQGWIRVWLTCLNRTLFEKALEILKTSECHPGAICRTAFALSETYSRVDNKCAAMQFELDGRNYRDRIANSMRTELGTRSQDYDKFVVVPCQ